MSCKICGGSRQTVAIETHPQTKLPYARTRPCICAVSELVSEECPLLGFLGDQYLPFNQIHKSLQFDPTKLGDCPNLLISGNYDTLALNIKSIIMKHRFNDPKPLFLFCRAIDVLHDFYVQQNDGTSPHLSDTNKFALVVMSLDTQEKNDKLKTCIAQVVYMRLRSHRPTWVYLPEDRPSLVSCSQEFSEDLERYTQSYRRVTLGTSKEVRRTSVAKNGGDAETFTGMVQ